MAQELGPLRERFRRASLAWHHLLGFDEPSPTSVSVRHKRHPSSVDHARRDRWLTFRTIDPLLLLRQVYGPEASFRAGQQESLRYILHDKSPLLVVLPTGAGKSLLFILPATYEGSGVSIIIVPLLALQEDFVRRY